MLPSHSSARVEVQHGGAGVSAQGITRLKSGVIWAEFSSGGSGENSISKIVLVGGGIQFLMILEFADSQLGATLSS